MITEFTFLTIFLSDLISSFLSCGLHIFDNSFIVRSPKNLVELNSSSLTDSKIAILNPRFIDLLHIGCWERTFIIELIKVH